MDTCVRNGNYDEALDLEVFVGKLAVLHSQVCLRKRGAKVEAQPQIRTVSTSGFASEMFMSP